MLKKLHLSEEAVNLAKNLKCSVCERHAATRPARRAAPPKQLSIRWSGWTPFTYPITRVRDVAAKLKKEVKFGELRGEEREKIKKAMEKEVRNNLKTKAYVILSPEESEEIRRNSPEKIVKSRFVMTEKSIDEDEIEAARQDGILLQVQGAHSTKAKARHVMKGFSEENAENLETTTPQCGRETVLSVLQMLCSLNWLPGYLDFTQAFHSGDDIKREIYAAQPHDAPLPGYSPRQ